MDVKKIKVTSYIKPEGYELIRKYCYENKISISEFLKEAIKEKLKGSKAISSQEGLETISVVDIPITNLDKPIFVQPKIDEKNRLELKKGNCKNCGYYKPVTQHEFVYGIEMDRIVDNLCDTCWARAKQDGSARE